MRADLKTTATELLVRFCAAQRGVVPAPRTLIVAAHPDDEVIGAGARLPHLTDIHILHVTDGAPRDGGDAAAFGFHSTQEYAAARRAELLAAMKMVGVYEPQLLSLDVADQSVSLSLSEVTQRLRAIIREQRPEIILTHPYEGGHPDHDGTAFCVHGALELLSDSEPCPALLEMTSYHIGARGIETGSFLPSQNSEERILALTPEERSLKHCLFECFRTQAGTLQYFSTQSESFRIAPHCDFTHPPHLGRLFYEQFNWGMSGDHFRGLARRALEELALEAPACR